MIKRSGDFLYKHKIVQDDNDQKNQKHIIYRKTLTTKSVKKTDMFCTFVCFIFSC